MQGVQVLEAVKRVEKALRTVQQGGGKELQVVLSQGGLESASSTVVKSAIVDKMSKYVTRLLHKCLIADLNII